MSFNREGHSGTYNGTQADKTEAKPEVKKGLTSTIGAALRKPSLLNPVASADPSGHPDARGSRLSIPVARAVDHCRVFQNGTRLPGEYTISSARSEHRGTDNSGFVWLGLHEPTEEQMDKVAAEFGIHPLIAEDAVMAHQRPKVERYDDQLLIVIRSVRYTNEESVSNTREVISTGEVQILVGPGFVITIRHSAELPDLSRRLDDDPALIKHGPIAVAWLVADILVDDYVRITDILEAEVDSLEEEVFTPGSTINIEQIYTYKREILEMRHATDPLAIELKQLVSSNKDLIPKQLRSYFRDVLDHETVVKDGIGAYDERLTALIDASVAKTTLQQNQDMRTISAVVGMAAAPTLIAGIYGMNFAYMPELQWRYGYPVVLGVIVLVVVIMFWWFRRNDWL